MLHGNLLNDVENMISNRDNTYDEGPARNLFLSQMNYLPVSEAETLDLQPPSQCSSFFENSLSGIGAGPLPTGFGLSSTQDRSNGISEFTKRRNWSQRVIEEIKDFLHILTPDGRIIYLSPSSEQLTGYTKEELRGKFITDFIHPDDSGMFLREFNESIASGHPLRFYYRFRRKDHTHTIFESHGHPHLASEVAGYGNSPNPNYCRGYFMMARPYLTKNAALLDSFLEHKIENQRLLKRIDDLRREEAEEEEEDGSHRKWQKRQESSEIQSDATAPSSVGTSHGRSVNLPKTPNYDSLAMPPPAKPLNAPLTRQALEESTSHLEPDSIKDKMARFEGITRIESIEMLTGLRYKDGERSTGISTGAQSPILLKGDAGISIPLEREIRNEKKRKSRFPDEYVCTDCGRSNSYLQHVIF